VTTWSEAVSGDQDLSRLACGHDSSIAGLESTPRSHAPACRTRLCGSAGRPAVDTIKGSRHSNMKEVRSSGGRLRAVLIFDPSRRAILPVAGDRLAFASPQQTPTMDGSALAVRRL
jgi:hypothetical protein